MTEVDACRSVLIEVLTILAKDLDKLVVVGGWVPELAFPERGHIGSLDVDLALDATRLHPMAYESIGGKWAQAGYLRSPEMMFPWKAYLPGSHPRGLRTSGETEVRNLPLTAWESI